LVEIDLSGLISLTSIGNQFLYGCSGLVNVGVIREGVFE